MMKKNTPTPRTMLITGASTGIGAACALELDRRGYRVFAGVRREEDGEALRQKASSQLVPIMLDVTDAEQIAAAVERIADTVGDAGLAGLVNNAGIVVTGPLELVPMDALRRQFEVNLFGAVAAAQACLPLLRRGQGRIVNISSVNGRISPPYLGPYSASKFALEAISDAMRGELRNSGVKVALVEPGPIATPIWRKSRNAVDELTAAAVSNLFSFYADDFDAVRRTTEQAAARALPVQRAVATVMRALTARRPKARYTVGLQSRILIGLIKFLPDRLRDRLVAASMGLR